MGNEVFSHDESEQVQKLRSKLSKHISKQFHGLRVKEVFDPEKGYQRIFNIAMVPSSQEKRGPKERFDLVNSFLLSLGFTPFPQQDHMRRVDQQEARQILIYLLVENLAYPHPEKRNKMSDKKAALIAEQILELFSSNASYFTNARFSDDTRVPYLSAGNPHTLYGETACIAESRTCEAGLILLDLRRIGLLWATAED